MARPVRVVALGTLVISILGVAMAAEPPALFKMAIAGLRDAQIAPDEREVAALVFQMTKPGTLPVEIQIWNIRRRSLVQTRRFEVSIPSMVLSTCYVRYSADGLLLAVYAGEGTVHVFRSSDLHELNQIPLELSSAQLSGFEISPSSHVLAIRRSFNRGGDVRIYDLDSGRELRGWAISKGFLYPLYNVLGVAWRGDGRQLAVTAPDNGPCTRFAGTIYIFDPDSMAPANHFRVGFLPGSLAFGSDDKLYVASMTCGGYFAHWTTDLPIYDAKTGKQVGKIPAQKVGIRRTIAISGNRRILLAYADREKTTFEGLEDTLKVTDAQWQIVELATGQVLFTTTATIFDQSSLSTSGRFLLNLSPSGLQIFPVPGN
jgi:WD40 repeat protein